MVLKVYLLGAFQVLLDGQPVIGFASNKVRALLAYLAAESERPHSRETLMDLLWPEWTQPSARGNLRYALSNLRKLLTPVGGDLLITSRQNIQFNCTHQVWLDISEFRRQVASLDGHRHPRNETCPQCVETLRAAVELARGDFLAGFSLRDSATFDDWQFFKAEQLRRETTGALKKLVISLQANGSCQMALEYANRWLALDPLNEEAHRQIMQLFALQGERYAALRQYLECEHILRNELGAAPEQETVRLYNQIQNGTLVVGSSNQSPRVVIPLSPSLPTEARASWLDQVLSTRGNNPVSYNLPPQPTPFVGRREELKKIAQILTDPACWLLTLLGPGGIGKTRLAIQVALEQTDAFAQGLYFVPLVSADSSLAITSAIANSLGLDFRPDGPSPEQQVCNYLGDKNILLVLDSFEHLVGLAELLQRIHVQADRVKFLITSRHRLQLQGEWVLNIRGMKQPGGVPKTVDEIKAYSAVDLFIQCARRAHADFQVTEQDLDAITRLARLLDGSPLGLELAANWIKVLSCEDIVIEISRNPDFLETQLRDFPARHRSLRAVFDQSWSLLSRREKRLFPRLSVFRGDFSRVAAEQVAGISFQELVGLTDKSLVQRTSGGRFILHELLRQYGNERLSKSQAEYSETYDRYSHYYCTRLNQWGAMLKSPQQGRALKELEEDFGNVLSAWDWAIDHHQAGRLELALDGLGTYFLRSMRYLDGKEACKKAAAALLCTTIQPTRKLRARLLAWQAAFCLNLECLEETRSLLEESQAVLDEFPSDEVKSEKSLLDLIWMILCFVLGQPEKAADYYELSLDLAQESGGQMAPSVLFFWKLLMNAGVFSPRLWSLIERTLPYKRQSGDIFETACLLQTLGVIAGYHHNDLAKMAGMMEESITLFRQLDESISQSLLLDSVNTLLNIRGQFSDLLPIRQKRLAMAKNLGEQRMIGYAQAELGETFYHLGNYKDAEKNIRVGMTALKADHPYEHALWQQHLGNVLLARGHFDQALELCLSSLNYFRSAGEKGWASTALASLSHAEYGLGKRADAWEHALESLRILTEIHAFAFFIPRSLAILALLDVDRGNVDMARELQAQISLQPFWANSRWYTDLYGNPVKKATSGILSPERTTANRMRSTKDLWEIAKFVLETEKNVEM